MLFSFWKYYVSKRRRDWQWNSLCSESLLKASGTDLWHLRVLSSVTFSNSQKLDCLSVPLMSQSRRAEVGSRALWYLSGGCRGRGKCYSLLWQEAVLGIWLPSSHMPASRSTAAATITRIMKEDPAPEASPLCLCADTQVSPSCVCVSVMETWKHGNMHSQRTNLHI